jgi:hypothetical protein
MDDKAAIPSLEGVSRSNGRERFEVFSLDRMGQHRQSSALDVSERNALALEFRFQDAVFFPQVDHDMTLVAVNFGSQPSDQEWQDHGLTSGVETHVVVT